MIVNVKSAQITGNALVILLTKINLFQALSADILRLKETLQDSRDIENDNGYVIKNEGCIVPHIKISHDSIWNVYQYSKKIEQCPVNQHPVIKKNKTHIWIMNGNLRHHHARNNRNFRCCYIILKKHLNATIGIDSSGLRDCIYFKGPLLINYEYIRVICRYKSNVIYDQMFFFAVKKPFTQQRLNPFTLLSDQSLYNIVILGLSSVSRLNFHRTMKYTSSFAKDKGAIELLGYNKVADDTFGNVIPTIVGMNTEELNRTCWPNAQTYLDHCPYIWERFKDSGFYTILAEDTTEFGIFKTNHFGFDSKPTDYYLHPFTTTSSLKNNKHQSVCLGDEYYYQFALNHINNLISILLPSKFFALFWESSVSREQLNIPNLLDRDFKRFLQRLNENGYLNDTFVFVLSDSGLKYGDIHMTKRTQFEEQLPIASILVPPSFSEKYPLAYENLKTNSRRLSTAYDLHETLIDLINLSAISNEELLDRTLTQYTNNKGISLFLPIPGNRTCQSADIEPQWCACTRYS